MREPVFSGKKWEMRYSPAGWARGCSPLREDGERPLDHVTWVGGAWSAGLTVKLHLKCLHCGSSWSPLYGDKLPDPLWAKALWGRNRALMLV